MSYRNIHSFSTIRQSFRKEKAPAKNQAVLPPYGKSEFDNKATRLALCDGDGQYIIGTDDNSASVIDANGKPIWNGDYQKN